MKTPESMDQYLRMTDEQKMQLLGLSTQQTTPEVCDVRSRDCTLSELEADLANARRQIDVLATLYADCGDCSICPVETGSRRACDQAECIAAVKEWSLAEARNGRG